MNKILKNKKILTHALIIVAIVLLAAITLQSGFAATAYNIDNTTSGGIKGTLATATDGDTLELDEGTYTGNNNTNMTINKNITIQGKTKDKVILDAQELSRIFLISNNLNVTFINITFINGYGIGNGGAIAANVNSTLSIINCTFSNNSVVNVSFGGGAVYCRENSKLIVTNSIFTNNYHNGSGGGLYANDNSVIIITDSIFINNSARNGGAVAFRLNSSLTIYNSTFINNAADLNGGGICIMGGGNAIIKDSIITNNAATNGGGIFVISSNLTILNSTINNNTANDGGGILATTYDNSDDNSTVNIYDSNLSGNEAYNDGGGVSSSTGVNSSGDSTINIDNSAMNNNSASNNGGGIFSSTGENSTGNSVVNINGSDISSNGAGNDGGGVSSSTGVGSEANSTVNIDNSTINDNTAGNEGGAISSNTGENSTGNSTVNVNDSDLENNSGGNGGDTIFSSTGDGSSGDSTVNVGGDSTITNNNPNRDDGGLFSSTGDNSTGESKINIDPSVTITRLSASSTIVAPNATVGKPTTIRGVAKDQNNKPLANIKLTVTIDGKIYTVTTNSAGEWSLTYIPTKIANIQVTVALNQNNVYYAFSKTASFRAIQTVTLTISAPTINQGKKTNIKVTLKDANGNILKNKKITITIKKKTYTGTTNNNGIATFKIAGLKGGKYSVISNFAGDNDYKSLTVSGIQKVYSKVNLGIISIKKIKSSNKKNPKYKITIINKGSLRSKATVLSLFHIRNGIKIKTKYFKVKAIGAGKKISIIVDYFPDKAKHRYCIAHYTIDPKNKNKEIILANNKKSISLKH